jgi:hypothetical protein
MTSPRVSQLRLGWQYAMAYPDPGPPPRRPTPPEPERLSPDWAAAQRREESQLNRPLKAAFAVAVALGLVLVALGAAGSLGALLTGLGVTCCALIAAVSGYALWQGERALRSRMADERARIGRAREAQESRLFAGQAEHAAQMQEWQVRRLAYERQKRWYAVRVPPDAHRTDIAGGTLSGWSAMLTTAAASQLAAGGEITVLDLTGAAVALDLLGVARARGTDPLVWVLPGDLPRLNLTGGLSREALADLWSAVAASVGEPGPAGDPSLDRARALESRLRKLATAGTGFVPPPRSALRVIALDQRVGAASSRMLGTYLTVALTHLLHGDPRHGDPRHGDPRHRARPGMPGQHTLFVLGADKLRGETLDRLSDACERSATGLVLAYQGIPAHVRPRLGRGNAVVAFMRLAGAEDAGAASEELGTGHHLVLSQLTETIGGLASDISGGVYTSMASAPSTGETSTGETSTGETSGSETSGSGGEADAAAVRTSTAWGMATAKATADGESFAQALERSRELLAGPDELQHLPASAMIIRYAGPGGRQVLLADVNPGIGGLAAATGLTLGEFRAQPAGETPDPAAPADRNASPPGAATPSPVQGRPAPNVGPPPRRLDWRRGRF